MQIVLFEKIRWISSFSTSIKGNFKRINGQGARNINYTLLLKMSVVLKQKAILVFLFYYNLGLNFGYSPKRLSPGTNPLPFVCTILDRKGTPFVYPLVTNGTSFAYLILNAASLFNCCKYTIFTI